MPDEEKEELARAVRWWLAEYEAARPNDRALLAVIDAAEALKDKAAWSPF